MKESSPDATNSSALDETAAAGTLQPQIGPATNMSEANVNHATRDPRFLPGARQAFFSTNLGTDTPRPLDLGLMPAVARSVHDPVLVVQAATYWQVKYKNQCLCIFPNQGWVVEDLWDAADIHVEGRRFCEEMLVFIARDTWYAADTFAKDWAQRHSGQIDFTRIQIGDVYNVNDPLAALDQIFVSGELTSFPRVFLWHVAFILISDWNDANLANATALGACQNQQLSDVAQQGVDEAKKSPVKVSTSDGKRAATSPSETGRTDSPVPTVPDQPKVQLPLQRIMPHSSRQPNDHHVHTRYNSLERATGPSLASPNLRTQALKVPKGNRNLGSPLYNQSQGWIENENRTIPGPYPRQQSVPTPGIQPPPYVPPPMAMNLHMNTAMMPGPAMNPYVLGPPVLPHPGYPVQPMDSAMVSRGHMGYQPGAQPILMGDATNMHFPGYMGSQVVDPRAPVPRRFHHQNTHQLFDPYNGSNRKFSGAHGYNDGGKKGGPSNFLGTQNRGRKASTSNGRTAHNSYNNYVPPTGSRYTDTSIRRRSSEDDVTITGDAVSGCGHTWIGPNNTTVKELWVGDLPHDVCESELMQLFEQTVRITPASVSLRSNVTKEHFHAFVTFASCDDARAALNINRFSPRLRNGEVRPSVSVPRRYYQKDAPYMAQSDHSRTIHAPNNPVRGSENTLDEDRSTVASADSETATASSTVLYSPQDARSGLPKKPAAPFEATNLTESGSPELETPNRQETSPTRKNKGKNKHDSPTEPEPSADDVPNSKEIPEVDALPAAAATEDRQSTTTVHKDAEDIHSTEVDVDSTSNTVQDVSHATEERHGSIAEPLEQSAQLDSSQSKDEVAQPISPPTPTETVVKSTPSQNLQDEHVETPAHENDKEAADDISDNGAKNDTSLHSAPEARPEAIQMELEAEVRDQATDANHGTAIPTSETTQGSLLQDSSSPPAASDQPSPDTAQELHPEPQEKTPAPSNKEDNPEDLQPEGSGDQNKGKAEKTPHTEADSVKEDITMSTPTKDVSTDTVKKSRAQQVQSLHPFATKSKAQAKKEKETKRKQQKKEEADRIAKAKADKADKVASLKKAKSGTDSPPMIETSKNSAASSVAADTHSDLEVASPNNDKPAPEGKKKSKGKSKAKIAGTNEECNQKSGEEMDEIAQSSADTSTVTTSVPQNAPEVEATNIPTATKGVSAGTGTQFDSSLSTPSSPAVLTPDTSHPGSAQPNTVTTHPSLSRHSSISTIAGDDICRPTDISSAPSNTIDDAATETPKKKKNKRKNKKKKKAPGADPGATAEPHVGGNTAGPAFQDTYHYDPYTSEMTHIQAIRYNIKHDTTSYFARTNARMEKERLEREALQRETKEHETTDLLSLLGHGSQNKSSG